MANRRPSSTQAARKGSQARRNPSSAASARNSATSAGARPQTDPGSARSGAAKAGAAKTGAARTGAANGKAAAALPTSTDWTPQWLRLTTLGLSLIGLGLSIYLTIAHLVGAHILACSNSGLVNCEAVTTSPESELFGVLPVAELGLAFYVFMTVINLPWLWRPEWRWLPARGRLGSARLGAIPLAAWRLRLASVIIGVLFILYLIYTELITLRTICLWCTYVHITTFVLFVFLVAQATFWGSPAKATADKTASRAVR